MRTRRCTWVLLAAALGLVAGCATALDKNWGSSYQQAKQSQTLNPQACERLDPVEGIDGRASEIIMKGYYESIEEAGLYTRKDDQQNPLGFATSP